MITRDPLKVPYLDDGYWATYETRDEARVEAFRARGAVARRRRSRCRAIAGLSLRGDGRAPKTKTCGARRRSPARTLGSEPEPGDGHRRASRTVLDQFRLDGRRALVTGGGRGLGRAIAQALAEAGADVALASRTLATCEDAAGEIAAATGRRALAFAADVSAADDVKRLVAEVEQALGPIDILVNNAGINIRGAIEDLAEADWDAVIDINLKAPFLCARAVGPGHARARLGPRHQPGLDPERDRDPGPRPLRVGEGRGRQPHARARPSSGRPRA